MITWWRLTLQTHNTTFLPLFFAPIQSSSCSYYWAATNMSGVALRGVIICDTVKSRLVAVSLTFVRVLVNYIFLLRLLCCHFWINPLVCVYQCVFCLKRNMKSQNWGQHCLHQPNVTWKAQQRARLRSLDQNKEKKRKKKTRWARLENP